MKLKRIKKAADPPSRKAPSAPLTPVFDERVKTSIVVRRSILVKAQARSRAEGLTLNGAINQALFQWANAPAHGTPASSPQVVVMPPTARPYTPAGLAPPKPFPSDGYTREKESKEDMDCFCDWDTIRRYAALNRKHGSDGPGEMAARMGISIEQALAADIAQQLPEFERYMAWREKQQKWDASQKGQAS